MGVTLQQERHVTLQEAILQLGPEEGIVALEGRDGEVKPDPKARAPTPLVCTCSMTCVAFSCGMLKMDCNTSTTKSIGV